MKLTKFKIITFGCRVNQAESRMLGERIVKLLNCRIVKLTQEADLVILNTCCVTVKAEKEVRQTIRRIKKDNPKCFLVITGCWTEKMLRSTAKNSSSLRSGTKLASLFESHLKDVSPINKSNGQDAVNTKSFTNLYPPREQKLIPSLFIDLLISNKDKKELPIILKKQFNNLTMKHLDNETIYRDKYANDKKAIIKVQDGCNNFCSYCIVPYVRGRSISQPVEEILREIRQKEKEGIEEIILTGIDLEDYHFKLKTQNSNVKTITQNLKLNNLKNDLAKLIRLILVETKIKKISFGSMGWKIFDKEFLNLYRLNSLRSSVNRAEVNTNFCSVFESRAKKICLSKQTSAQRCKHKNTHKNCISLRSYNRLSPHFHIPMQSGCDATLKRMKRNYRTQDLRDKIYDLRKKIPNFTFSTDLIVGFPGETEEEFRQTLEFITEIKKILGKSFTKAHIFRYSSRPGTVAAKMEDKQSWERIEAGEKHNRASLLQVIFN